MKEGEQRVFILTFPENHVQKLIAGKEIEFEITLNELYHLELPGVDDEFAKTLGLPDFATLRKTLEENLQGEKDVEESQRQEKEMLEQIAEKSRFEEIPDLLVNEEINKMLSELQRSVENQGVGFEQYLKNLGKTLGQLKIDLASQALIRIKVALLLRAIAEEQNIVTKTEEVDAEIDKIAEHYKDEDTRKQIYSPQYREYTEQILKNRNTIKFLKELIVKH
jgi:trigger factor